MIVYRTVAGRNLPILSLSGLLHAIRYKCSLLTTDKSYEDANSPAPYTDIWQPLSKTNNSLQEA